MAILTQYQTDAAETARAESPEWRSILLFGLQGEVGSLVAEYKKKLRDGKSNDNHRENVREELGDVLWYTANIAHIFEISLGSIEISDKYSPAKIHDNLFQLSIATGSLIDSVVSIKSPHDTTKECLSRILNLTLAVAQGYSLSVDELIAENLKKVRGRWQAQVDSPAKHIDANCPSWERLPRTACINFIQLSRGHDKPPFVIVRMNNLNIGDRLTDNADQDDGYRFHDAFHLAYAAVLGWSPVTRALFKAKRKSDPKKDENEDGARAQIIEEAITFQVYDYARRHSFLAGYEHVDHDLLKTIVGLCRGLESAQFASWEWELAIMRGYEVFRGLRELAQGKLEFGAVVELNADKRLLRIERQLVEAELLGP